MLKKWDELDKERQRQSLLWALFDYQETDKTAKIDSPEVLALARSRTYNLETYTIAREEKVPVFKYGKKTKETEIRTVEDTVYRLTLAK